MITCSNNCKPMPQYDNIFVKCAIPRLLLVYFHSFFLKNGPIPATFSVYFRLFTMSQLKFKFKLIKA